MPLLKFLQASNNKKQPLTANKQKRKKRNRKKITLSKTREWGQAIDSEHLSEMTEEEMEVNFIQSRIKGFAKWDLKYFIPFFTRRFTQQVNIIEKFYQLKRGLNARLVRISFKYIRDYGIFLGLQELKDCKTQMTDLTNQWYQAIRISPDQSEDDGTGMNGSRASVSSVQRII